MSTYQFEAFTKEGNAIQGELEATSQQDAERLLSTRADIVWISRIQTLKAADFRKSLALPSKLKISELEILSYQLGVLLKAGINVNLLFETLRKSLPSPRLVSVVKTLQERIRKGSPFYQAFEQLSGLFPQFYVSMVHSGEVSGTLDKTFLKLAQFYRKLGTLRQKLFQAMIYPVFVLSAGVAVFIIAEVVVLPKFQSLYDQLRVPLPVQTRILIALSHFLRVYWPFLIGVFLLAWIAYRVSFRWEKSRQIIDGFLLSIPLFGNVLRNYESLMFCFGLGNLISSGILITDALSLCVETTNNRLFRQGIERVEKEIRKGKSFSAMLKQANLLNPVAEQLLVTGDTTGQVGELAREASEYLEAELSVSVEKLLASFEPMLLVMVAAGIGFLLFSLYMPIFGAAKHILH